MKEQEQASDTKSKSQRQVSVEPRVLKLIFDYIKQYYSEKKISTAFTSVVLEKLGKLSFGVILGKAELKSSLSTLSNQYPQWIWFVSNPEGELLKMNKARCPVAFEPEA
jgi:hypothetical protein